MARKKYRETQLNTKSIEQLVKINSIIEEYQDDGYVLTLRQLYYQLVSRDVIPNKQNEYAKLSRVLKEGRMAGLVDWGAIEDRLRQPECPASWDNPQSIMRSVLSSYRKHRNEGQPNYIEVWVEKDALSGVLSRVTEQYHVPIVVNRGYSSVTAMHDAYERFSTAYRAGARAVKVIYLGDYDPSGMDMIRDVNDRIVEFMEHGGRFDFTVQAIALTKQQIDLYNPPPNPAKKTDPRSDKFIAERGEMSWEVDALRPEILNKFLTTAIEDSLDMKLHNQVKIWERQDLDKLRDLTAKL